MKLKYKFVIKPIGDQFSASTLNASDFNGVLFFSEVGKYIFEELEFGIEKEELIEKLMRRYEGDAEEIKNEADKFINILKENQLLED